MTVKEKMTAPIASVGADVEERAMLLNLTDNFLRARTTVGSEAIHTEAVGFQ